MENQLSGTVQVVVSIVFLATCIVEVWAMWRIAKQAGYSGLVSLWMLVPFVNLVLFFVFAFGTWPVTRRLQQNASANELAR